MGFTYHHLNEPDVRAAMVARWQEEWDELEASWPRGACYGKQLTEAGWDAFPFAMREALAERDDTWLQRQMLNIDFWRPFLIHNTKGGEKLVDYNKPDAVRKLCLGEFNIAYVRGLASALLDRGESHCEVYRADAAYDPRGECSAWEGRQFPLGDVIAGHRARYFPPPGDRSIFSVPSGPNCHHSIRAVQH
jgi:hypothetical protein